MNAHAPRPSAHDPRARVAAIVVTCNPDGERFPALLASLQGQVERVIIVDNGSNRGREALAHGERMAQTELILLHANLGIGAGHNAGIRRAKEHGATHALLMDQDSIPALDMVTKLLAAEKQLTAEGKKVGAVGPSYFDRRLAKRWPFFRMSGLGIKAHYGDGPGAIVPCDFLISSGTLTRLSVLDDAGPINESYFLEHVDTEWSLRVRQLGYQLFGICAAEMDHSVGDDAIAIPLSKRHFHLYKPYRHYYLFRNAVLLSRERYATLPWKLNEVRRLSLRMVFYALFVPPRMQRLRYMILGLVHGMLGRTGHLRAVSEMVPGDTASSK